MTVTNIFNKKRNWKLHLGWPAALCLTIFSQSAIAVPFPMFDARTMAMGGVGVASGSRAAVFNNPALLTTADEIHEWFLLAPALNEQINDPDKVDDTLAAFQQAADTLDANNNPTNRAAVQQQLDALAGKQYAASSNSAFVVTIPSRILSGAAFFNIYEATSAKPQIRAEDLTAPGYASTLGQRGLRITENGVSAAKMFEDGSGWSRNMAFGLNVKFLLIEGYGYSESIDTADVDISRDNSTNGGQFAFDIGILKEFGVWKIGLVAKNIVPGNYKYGDSGDSFKIEPQLRAGFAYQSRYSIFELDIDLLENAPIGFDQPSQIIALGWEWQTWRWLTLRAGYNQNLTGNEAGYAAAGIGVNISSMQIDVGAYNGDFGEGLSAQVGFQF